MDRCPKCGKAMIDVFEYLDHAHDCNLRCSNCQYHDKHHTEEHCKSCRMKNNWKERTDETTNLYADKRMD